MRIKIPLATASLATTLPAGFVQDNAEYRLKARLEKLEQVIHTKTENGKD